ncbi:BON domain-containing protein [Luteimonas fraxinea]|uniref:BON domain-containing protein n=1 Tax=Luteimonas fraxinea TaxID=2901869 RepID=A0ABS8U9J2_9GAMM|nr:BON domain-containing protein [Luteimonas fraxinea]MCD9095647.1 BON domain-containing protein [Luteimonas fraxinea]MCD9124229.1 BON domain-containing protein [Luteimonas fraxinea]UHH11161.1 BON domain-containing protein [Luteimonas fraxinea]
MTSNLTRIPLAIAMSSMLALAVGCSNDRTADDQAATTPATDPAMQAPPPAATPDTTATGAPRTDAPMDGSANGMNNGMESDQPGSDTWITTKVKSSLLADSDVSGLKIDVETVNGVVTLTGQVEQATQVTEATRIAREIEGVTDVVTTNLVTTQ